MCLRLQGMAGSGDEARQCHSASGHDEMEEADRRGSCWLPQLKQPLKPACSSYASRQLQQLHTELFLAAHVAVLPQAAQGEQGEGGPTKA